MKMFLGVDGGGSSTSFLLFDHNGNEVYRYEHESLHFMSVGFDAMKSGFAKVYDHFESLGYDISNFEIVIGLGGYGADAAVRNKIDEAVHSVFPQALIMSDSKIAMISALNGNKGVYLISGTGSISMYYDGENVHRQGGFGYHLGDEGSGYWIGKKILALFTQEVDGRRPHSVVSDRIMDFFNLNSPYELIAKLNDNESRLRFVIASLAGVFGDCTDEAVLDIFKQAGKELANFANGFKINEPTKIAFGGSVLRKNDIVRKSCIESLNKCFEVFESDNKVEYTAYLIKNNKI